MSGVVDIYWALDGRTGGGFYLVYLFCFCASVVCSVMTPVPLDVLEHDIVSVSLFLHCFIVSGSFD